MYEMSCIQVLYVHTKKTLDMNNVENHWPHQIKTENTLIQRVYECIFL